MKKTLLTLGAAVSVIAPITSVVSCGGETVEAKKRVYNFLETENIIENTERYLDVEGKSLIWDNVREDGFNGINLTDLRDMSDEQKNSGVVFDEDYLINTDLNIPTWVEWMQGLHGLTFNNELVISAELMDREPINDEVGSDYPIEFNGTTLKNGVVLEEGVKNIPLLFLYKSHIEKEGDIDYKIHLPSSIEYIGSGAFADIYTDVIDYDLSHLTNWSYDAYETRFIFGSDHDSFCWFDNKEITLPQFKYFSAFSDYADNRTYYPMFNYQEDYFNGPSVIKYKSEYIFDTYDRGSFVPLHSSIPFTNIY